MVSVTLTFSDDDAEVLRRELQPDESLEDVLQRLVQPLIDRDTEERFRRIRHQLDTAQNRRQLVLALERFLGGS